MDSKDDKEEKTREVADMMMYYFNCNFLQLGCELLQWWWLTRKFFILSTYMTTLNTYEMVGVRHCGQQGQPGVEDQ